MQANTQLQQDSAGAIHRWAIFAYGLIAYVLFLGTFLYAVGFIHNVVPKSIDSGTPGPIGTAMLVNALLLGLFAVQHTIMARPAFKAWWTRIIPRAMERSTFVLVTCGVFALMFWQWRPMPEFMWHVENPAVRATLYAVSLSGVLLVLYSSFCIDHFDLFGLRQVMLHLRRKAYTHPGFAMPVLYRLVRNPLMLGFLIAFWSTPDMTLGHLFFAAMTTGYIFFGVSMEERDLLKMLDDEYRQYRARTPMLIPGHRRRRPQTATAPSAAVA